jgi:hypothetical protein
VTQIIPETSPDFDKTRLIERPNGFYWQSKTGDAESGPFATLREAIQDMQFSGDSAIEPGETVEEAEAEIQIADWIDPETGVPAEEGIPRLEEH